MKDLREASAASSALYGQMQKHAEELKKRRLEEEKEKISDFIVKIGSSQFEKGAAYSNIMILAGYAGSFTIWSNTKEFLTDEATIIVAILLGVSLLVFTSWEIFKMVYSAGELRVYNELARTDGETAKILNKLELHKKRIDRKQLRLTRFWVFILILTIIPAYLAIAILMYNYVAKIANLVPWP